MLSFVNSWVYGPLKKLYKCGLNTTRNQKEVKGFFSLWYLQLKIIAYESKMINMSTRVGLVEVSPHVQLCM